MNTKLFVGNLPFSLSTDELRDLFSPSGEVKDVFIPTDRDTGRPRGFAFVEMSSASEAEAAINAMNGQDVGGRTIQVNEARERERRGPGGGGDRW